MKKTNKEIIHRQFILDRQDIYLLQFIIEGYEGLASVTTMEPTEARIDISIMPDFLDEVSEILDALKSDIRFTEITI